MSAIMRRAFSRFSLRVVITTTIVSLLTMTAGVTWFFTFRNGQVSIRELADQLGRQSMRNIRQHLETYVSTAVLINDLNSFAFSLNDAAEVAPERLVARFKAEINRFEDVTSIGYGDEERESVAVGREIMGFPFAIALSGHATGYHLDAYALDKHGSPGRLFYHSPKVYDPHMRPWYLDASKARAPTWSQVYLMASGEAGIDAVKPVYAPQGELRGVLDVTLTLTALGAFLRDIRVTPHAEAFILDHSGMLVAASTVQSPFATKGDHLELVAASESKDPVVRLGARAIDRVLGMGKGIEAARQLSLEIGNRRQIVYVSPFQGGPGLDWVVAEVIPESDFAQHIYDDMRSTAAFAALFLFLSVFAALLLARRVTAPLELLSNMARSLAAGDLSRTIEVEGTDEVGQLAASFNLMAAELRRSFASLAESEARYRTFVAISADGIFRFEARAPMPLSISEDDQIDWIYRHFSLAECNDAAVGMLGRRAERDVIGLDPGVWLPQSDPGSLDSVRAMIKASFQVVSSESSRPDSRGKMRWLLTSVVGVVESGSLTRIWGVMRDITDRKEAEEGLRQSEIRYRAIFHRSAVSLWELDTSKLRAALTRLRDEGNQDLAGYMRAHPDFLARALHLAEVIDVNETTLRLFEAKSRAELLGPLDATFDPGVLADFLPEAIARAESGKQHDVETTVRSRTGRRLNVIMHFDVPAVHDALSSTLVSVVDITKRTQAEEERSRLEEELRQAQKMEIVGRLAGGISHDISNLLTPILGYSELLQSGAEQVRQDAAEVILGAARRIRDLTHKLLAFSRKQRLTKSVADLRVVVRDFQMLLRRTIANTVEIRVECPEELGLVTVDVGQVEQVLMNLAVNAQDAMPGGGALTFALRDAVIDEEWTRGHPEMTAGEYVCLTVSDTGTGMDEATRRRIFEPFFTTKETGKGTGLGLSTVYGIVRQHGGLITVDSEPGWGTVFTIYFPRMSGGGASQG